MQLLVHSNSYWSDNACIRVEAAACCMSSPWRESCDWWACILGGGGTTMGLRWWTTLHSREKIILWANVHKYTPLAQELLAVPTPQSTCSTLSNSTSAVKLYLALVTVSGLALILACPYNHKENQYDTATAFHCHHLLSRNRNVMSHCSVPSQLWTQERKQSVWPNQSLTTCSIYYYSHITTIPSTRHCRITFLQLKFRESKILLTGLQVTQGLRRGK